MKAVVYHQYGSPDVLEYADVPKPIPQENEVLIKVRAASVNAADWHFLRADPFLMRLFSGLLKPKNTILGLAVAGQVEEVGKNVKLFHPGDEVFGDLFECSLGGFAEYVCAREEALALKPANSSFEEAATVPVAATTALQALRDHGHIQSGQKVLINGAGGGVGTFAVQIAKSFGAEVTGVCSTGNLEMVRSLGADYVIDYTKDDFIQGGQKYDLILAANGHHSVSDYRRALKSQGTCVISGGSPAQVFQAMLLGPWISMTGNQKIGNMMAKPNQNDLVWMKEMMEAGKVKPVIDRHYSLSEVAQAIRYLEEGHARGKVVITV